MFLDKDYILENDWAKKLYHNHAEKMPIIDYHCHLNPKEIYENKAFADLSQLWLYDNGAGDHYKWRLMRANGENEANITGNGKPYERLEAFAHTMEKAIGNPIFEWSNLELRRFFEIDKLLTVKNAPAIWEEANAKLGENGMRAHDFMNKMQVKLVCTTDDPADDLRWHALLKEQEKENGFRVLPTLRPDKLMNIADAGYEDYLKAFAAISGVDIHTFADLVKAAGKRVDFFDEIGGRLADHGMNTFHYIPTSDARAEEIFARRLKGGRLSEQEITEYQSALTQKLMKFYKEHGWTLQMHMNVIRNASDRNFASQGPDHGFDSAGVQADLVENVRELLNDAQKKDSLGKMILYSLNPNDMLPLATLMQSFQGEGVQQIQLGCAWWVNDNYSGMKEQLTTLAQQSLLGNFTGMLTDSRSFMSYPRHEYFRRVLCQTIGEWVEQGRLPEDEDYLGQLVEDICYNNANTYFGF